MIALAFLALLSQQAPVTQKVLVMDLRANAVAPDQVRTLQSTLVTELARVPSLEVLSGDDVKNLVQLEASKQAAGCDVDGSCLAEIAGALGASLVVFGDVGKLGDLLVINLSLFDASKAMSVARTRLDVKDLSEVPTTLPKAVLAIVDPVLVPAMKAAYLAEVESRAKEQDPTLAAKEGPPLFVVDPKVVKMSASVGATVSSLIAKTAEVEGFRVFTRDDAKVIIGRSADLQELGADSDGASLGELGKAVGANHVLACIVSSVDDTIVVQARLIDVEKAAVVSRREVKASDFGGALVPAVEAATRLVLQPVFAGQKGTLQISVTEEGANVFVDDALVGTTPLEKSLSLPGGHHLVAVEKEGFIRFAEALRMTRGASLKRDVTLRPSVEFLEAYRSRNGLYRTLAWSASATALVAGGAAAAMLVPYHSSIEEVARIDAEFRAKTDLTEEQAAEGERLKAEPKNQAALWSYGFGVAGGAAAIAAGVAAYFWIFGDDPSRYDEMEAPAP